MPARAIPIHGATRLPTVTVDSYNVELRDDHGFVGDHANKQAFQAALQHWRERLREAGADPLNGEDRVDNRQLERILLHGEVEAAGLVLSAIESFAQALADICRRLLSLPHWRGTECILVGGGFRATRVGELAIGRASVLLQADNVSVPLRPIRHDPEQAGLVGAIHLVPSAVLAGYDAMLAADIGGTNIRAGLLGFDASHRSSAEVLRTEAWRHAEESPSRDAAVDRLAALLCLLADHATRERRRLLPCIGIGCPGVIQPDGRIERGGQNLPGDWEAPDFNLPDRLRQSLPFFAGNQLSVLLHNDAVVQGLSERSWLPNVAHWGVLTIGTGLGNARFTMAEEE